MSIAKNWDRMAEAYENFTTGPDSYSEGIEWPCIRRMLPDLSGKEVADLGCGTGRFSFLLEERGPARIEGIDISGRMLDIARERAGERGSIVSFVQADLARYVPDARYDFVFSSTLTHYIKDLGDFFAMVYGMVRSGGDCVISVMHPVYTAQYPVAHGEAFPNDDEWTVRYLDRSVRAYVQPWIEYHPDIADFLSTSYHHTFADYANAILGAGFALCEAREPEPPARWKTEMPERYRAFVETPSYLIFRLHKA